MPIGHLKLARLATAPPNPLDPTARIPFPMSMSPLKVPYKTVVLSDYLDTHAEYTVLYTARVLNLGATNHTFTAASDGDQSGRPIQQERIKFWLTFNTVNFRGGISHVAIFTSSLKVSRAERGPRHVT